jgi:hypothetical protein
MAVKGGQFVSLSIRRFARMLALPRMGSFSSTPKILNDDCQDNDIQMPINFSRYELIQYCQTQPQVHPMVKRAFRKVGESNVDSYGFKFRKLNALTKGMMFERSRTC